ncbi:MAG: hypothetical protein VW298_00360 [Candidatus Woesearchaeota archaeon]
MEVYSELDLYELKQQSKEVERPYVLLLRNGSEQIFTSYDKSGTEMPFGVVIPYLITYDDNKPLKPEGNNLYSDKNEFENVIDILKREFSSKTLEDLLS